MWYLFVVLTCLYWCWLVLLGLAVGGVGVCMFVALLGGFGACCVVLLLDLMR